MATIDFSDEELDGLADIVRDRDLFETRVRKLLHITDNERRVSQYVSMICARLIYKVTKAQRDRAGSL